MSGVTPEQRAALKLLAPHLPADSYLAGGVAVSARFAHRVSHDLDVFTSTSDPESLVDALAGEDSVRVTSRAADTVYLQVRALPVSVIRHAYPPLEPAVALEGLALRVASAPDLTAMKLHAIASRGAVRDFWDLHVLLVRRPASLDQALLEHSRRYPREDSGHVLRSLAYFGDADAAPLPRGLDSDGWTAIKAAFEARVRDAT